MINVKKYDVGFGDFLSVNIVNELQNNTLHLIIDCGSNIVHSSVGKRYIRSELSACTDVILTHFHSDHYSILYDNCNIKFRKLFVRKPNSVDAMVDFIAIACLKNVFSVSDKDLYTSSSWFIVDIISNLIKLKNEEVVAFEDGDIIVSNDLYYVKAIEVTRKSYWDEMKKLFDELGPYRSKFLETVKSLSQKYINFCNSPKSNFNCLDEKNTLLFLRKKLFNSKTKCLKKYIDNIYDEIVNESSAVIGVWSKDRLIALFLGDISLSAQNNISIQYNPVLLKLSHHGTYQYNSIEVLQKFNSTHKLITYGYGKCRKENKLLPELRDLKYTGIKSQKYVEFIIDEPCDGF